MMKIKFYFFNFHFLEMHKFCHMCQCVIGTKEVADCDK